MSNNFLIGTVSCEGDKNIMLDIISKYKIGREIQIGESKAIIVSDLIKFKKFYAIYADIIENIDFKQPCGTCKIHDRIALIIRDKKRLLNMRIKHRRKKSYILS